MLRGLERCYLRMPDQPLIAKVLSSFNLCPLARPVLISMLLGQQLKPLPPQMRFSTIAFGRRSKPRAVAEICALARVSNSNERTHAHTHTHCWCGRRLRKRSRQAGSGASRKRSELYAKCRTTANASSGPFLRARERAHAYASYTSMPTLTSARTLALIERFGTLTAMKEPTKQGSVSP